MKDIRMPSLLEYVGSPYGDDYESTSTSDAEITQNPPRTHPVGDDWIDPEEAENLFIDAVENGETPEDVKEMIQEIFEEHPYMHEELGEMTGRDYYKGAIDNFVKAFNDKFPGTIRYEG